MSLPLQEAHEEGSQDDRGILIIRWTSEESDGGKDQSEQTPNTFRRVSAQIKVKPQESLQFEAAAEYSRRREKRRAKRFQ